MTTPDVEHVDWDEMCLRAALEEVLRGERPLATARETRSPAPARRPMRRQLAAAAVAVLAVGAVVAVRLTAPGQDPKAPFVPFAPGAEWIYEVVRDGTSHRVTHTVQAGVPFTPRREPVTRTVWQVRVDEDGSPGFTFQYLACDERGVWRYANATTVDRPGLDRGAPVARLVTLPVGIEASWETHELETRRSMHLAQGAAPPRNRERQALALHGELVEPTTEVTVPAGTFAATHLVLAHDDGDVRCEEHLWLAKGVGIVKRDRSRGGKVESSEALVQFRPGVVDPDPVATLRAFLTERGDDGEPTWLETDSHLVVMRSRFAVVDRGVDASVAIWRVCGERVVPFDPRSVVDVNRWLIAEGWLGMMPPDQQSVLARTIAVTLARSVFALDGWRYGGETKFSGWVAAGEFRCSLSADGVDRNGGKRALVCNVELRNNGQVLRATIE